MFFVKKTTFTFGDIVRYRTIIFDFVTHNILYKV